MANFGVAADAWVGIGVEHTPNSYRFPHKWLPVRSESLTTNEANVYGRQLKGTADVTYVKAGNQSFSGNIEIEVLHDCMPHLIQAMRANVTHNAARNRYEVRPTSAAQLDDGKTLSLTCIKNDVPFFYTGLVITGLSLTTNDMLLVATIDFMGTGESDTRTTPEYPTLAQLRGARHFDDDQIPFGAGEYAVTFDGSQVFDMDQFTFEIDEGAEDQFRLQNLTRSPWFIKMGERDVRLTTDRDFNSRASYDNYKSQQQETVTIQSTRRDNSDAQVRIHLPHATVDNWDTPLSGGQGDLIRANTNYMSTPQAGELSYELDFGTTEVLPYTTEVANKAPTGVQLKASTATANGFTVEWSEGTDSANAPVVVGYVVRYRPKGGSVAEWRVANVDAVELAITGLVSGVTYDVEVAAAIQGMYTAGANAVDTLIGEYALTAWVTVEIATT